MGLGATSLSKHRFHAQIPRTDHQDYPFPTDNVLSPPPCMAPIALGFEAESGAARLHPRPGEGVEELSGFRRTSICRKIRM